MQRSTRAFVDLSPVRLGWTIDVSMPDGHGRTGFLRLPDSLTWMQQRRAIEERLRSWGYLVPPGAEWVREEDGSVGLPLLVVATRAA